MGNTHQRRVQLTLMCELSSNANVATKRCMCWKMSLAHAGAAQTWRPTATIKVRVAVSSAHCKRSPDLVQRLLYIFCRQLHPYIFLCHQLLNLEDFLHVAADLVAFKVMKCYMTRSCTATTTLGATT